MLLAGACSRPGSNSASQQFSVAAAGPNVRARSAARALDSRRRRRALDDLVVPHEVGVKVTVVPGRAGTLIDVGMTDVALTDDVSLSRLIPANLVESLDRSLVSIASCSSRRSTTPPTTTATITASRWTTSPPASCTPRRQCPRRRRPGTASSASPRRCRAAFAVPPDRDIVVGAALTAAGHDWNSSSSFDISTPPTCSCRCDPPCSSSASANRRRLPRTAGGGTQLGQNFTDPPAGIRFAVPQDGSLVRARCYCIPVYAPTPCRPTPGSTTPSSPLSPRLRRASAAVPQPSVRPSISCPPSLIANQACSRRRCRDSAHLCECERLRCRVRDNLWRETPADRRLRLLGAVVSGCRSGSRDALGRRGKSGHRRARVPGNSRTGKPDG